MEFEGEKKRKSDRDLFWERSARNAREGIIENWGYIVFKRVRKRCGHLHAAEKVANSRKVGEIIRHTGAHPQLSHTSWRISLPSKPNFVHF